MERRGKWWRYRSTKNLIGQVFSTKRSCSCSLLLRWYSRISLSAKNLLFNSQNRSLESTITNECDSMASLSYLLPSSRFPSLFPKHLSPLPVQISAFALRRGIGSSSVRLTGSDRGGVKVFAILQGGDESEEEEDEGGIKDYEGGEEVVPSVSPERWDVLGLGQAMVDFSGMVEDEFLEKLGLEKGTRKVVYHEERGRVLRAMDGCTYKAAAGGSLSNTLVALARLGSRSVGAPQLNIAMTGSVGSDPLGSFYRAKLRRANVHFLSNPVNDGTTGTVIVLTTPDAQRTMLAYQGTSSTVSYDPYLASLVSKTNILIVEGYLFELPDTIETIKRACQDARASGALVAVTASDVSCIKRCYDDFWDIIRNHTDILFANSNEARAFCNLAPEEAPRSFAQQLSHTIPLVSVTDGAQGSYLSVKGEAIYIPPSPCRPADTCGAGDAYASGILYGVLRGASDLKSMGVLASRVAAVVVGQQGTRLRVHDAERLAESFEWQLEKSRLV